MHDSDEIKRAFLKVVPEVLDFFHEFEENGYNYIIQIILPPIIEILNSQIF